MCGWAGSWRVYELDGRESGAVMGRLTVLLESVVGSSRRGAVWCIIVRRRAKVVVVVVGRVVVSKTS